jgi:hypothetical protein
MTGYRKLILTIGVFLATTVLMLMKLLQEASWLQLNSIVLPAFLAANIAERYLDNKRGKEKDVSE